MKRIDLNCDLGEGAGNDAELMPLVTSANIACGAHAGNLDSMIETVELALRNRVNIGAHPGYFDLEDFGRTERAVTGPEAGRLVLMQVEQLFEVAGEKLKHVKLHGALYNQVASDPYLAEAVAADLSRLWPDLIVYALAGSHFARAAVSRGLCVAQEVFADRRYRRDGTLVPRGDANAVISNENEVMARALDVVERGAVRAIDGSEVKVTADTICLHGDGPDAVALARRLREAFAAAGVAVKPFSG